VGAPWPPNLGLSTREYVSRMRAAVVHKHDLEGLVNIKEKTVFLDKVMKNYELDGDDRLEEEVFLRQLRREGGHSPPGYRRAPHSGSHVTLQATPPSASPTCLSARWGQSRPSSRERQQDGSFSARAASRNPTSPTKQQHLVDREAFDRTQSKLHQAALKGRGPVQGRAMTGTGRVKAQRTAHERRSMLLMLRSNPCGSRSTSSAKRLPVPSNVRPCPTPGPLEPRSVRRRPRPGTTPNGAWGPRPSRRSSWSASSK